MPTDAPLLAVEDLVTDYRPRGGRFGRSRRTVRAVDGVSFVIRSGEVLGLVGESGCGKSTLGASILRLVEPTEGRLRFDGEDVVGFDRARIKRFRREAQLLPQSPGASFDPRMSVGASVTEPLAIHGLRDRSRRRTIGEDLLERVGLAAADYDRYPNEFSGGQLQRLALARAVVVNPRLLVADEPVSGLDVSRQRQVLSLLADLQAELDLAILLISHDLSVVREVADRVAVMYLGELVEVGPTERILDDPAHPYTEALVSAIPEPDPAAAVDPVRLTGEVPDLADPPGGCRFHTRCPAVIQPDGVDLERATWRRLVDARGRLEAGSIDLERIAEVHAEGASPDELPPDRLASAVRDEFDLPDPVGDGAVEDALSAAIEAAGRGAFDRAAERLAEVVTTPCASHHPTRQPLGERREVACHLHHPPTATGEPPTGAADPSTAPDGPAESSGFEWVGE